MIVRLSGFNAAYAQTRLELIQDNVIQEAYKQVCTVPDIRLAHFAQELCRAVTRCAPQTRYAKYRPWLRLGVCRWFDTITRSLLRRFWHAP